MDFWTVVLWIVAIIGFGFSVYTFIKDLIFKRAKIEITEIPDRCFFFPTGLSSTSIGFGVNIKNKGWENTYLSQITLSCKELKDKLYTVQMSIRNEAIEIGKHYNQNMNYSVEINKPTDKKELKCEVKFYLTNETITKEIILKSKD